MSAICGTAWAVPDTLVTIDRFAEHPDDASLRVIEIDEDTNAHNNLPLPGVITEDWSMDLRRPVRRDHLDQAGFSGLLTEGTL